MAIRPEDGAAKVEWQQRWKVYVPSPLVSGDRLYVVQDDGIARCLRCATGKELWMQRLGAGVSSSPVLINGNIYVADFSENAVAVVTPAAKVSRIAQSPDCDGSRGGLDQPGEPIVWNGKLILTCFDKVTGPDKVNTAHDKPYTISMLDLISGE